MQETFIHPNFHVILIHYPLGLLTLGVLIETLCAVWRHPSLRSAGRWMLLLGALSCAPAALSGLYALREALVVAGADADGTWEQTVATAKWDTLQWQFMIRHVVMVCGASLLFLFGAVVWLSGREEPGRWTQRLMLLIAASGAALMGGGAWHAGEAIYLFNTGISSKPTLIDPTPDAVEHVIRDPSLGYFVTPLQLHLILAGLFLSLCALAAGLSLARKPALAPSQKSANPASKDVSHVDAERHPHAPHPSLLWAGVAMLTLGVIAAGVWTAGVWKPGDLIEMAQNSRRSLLHMALAGLMLSLPIALLFSNLRWPGRRAVQGAILVTLLIVVGLQIWLGTLLMFDTNQGPMLTANHEVGEKTSQHVLGNR